MPKMPDVWPTSFISNGAPHEFVLYEQWRDQATLDAHLAHLDRMIGLAILFDFFEQTRSVLYAVVA
jgi:antibiotic biosynthesis monooxygenase